MKMAIIIFAFLTRHYQYLSVEKKKNFNYKMIWLALFSMKEYRGMINRLITPSLALPRRL